MRNFRYLMCGLLAASLSLAACAGGSVASAGSTAPPGGLAGLIENVDALQTKVNGALHVVPNALNATTIDETALTRAFQAYDLVLSGVDVAVQTHVLVRNTPRALAVRKILVDVKHWLLAASAAQKAGSAQEMAVALSQASLAVAEARRALTQ